MFPPILMEVVTLHSWIILVRAWMKIFIQFNNFLALRKTKWECDNENVKSDLFRSDTVIGKMNDWLLC